MHDRTSPTRPYGSLHVTELARLAGVTPATVRYYSRVGLLQPQREPTNGYRCFSEADKHRVVFIRRAQALGLTISDIKSILERSDRGEVPCGRVRALVAARLDAVQQQLSELQAIEVRINQTLTAWEETNEKSPRNGEICPLIDRVDPTLGTEQDRPPARPRIHAKTTRTHAAGCAPSEVDPRLTTAARASVA